MTERLTEEFKDGRNILRKGIENIHHVGFGQFYAGEAIDKLSEYETAEEEGRLVVIPYKIGMTLFLPRRGEVLPFKVVGTRIYTNRTEIDLVYFGNNECYKFLSTHPTTEYIEREYYKTREEAEKALKEMEGNQSE